MASRGPPDLLRNRIEVAGSSHTTFIKCALREGGDLLGANIVPTPVMLDGNIQFSIVIRNSNVIFVIFACN
jgi:hypothetical protein